VTITAVLAISGCASSSLKVTASGPLALWLAEGAARFHSRMLCPTERNREERKARVARDDNKTWVDVREECER